MKYGIILGIAITIVWAILGLIQLWVTPFTAEVFFKISVTAGILLAVTIMVTLAIKEYLQTQKLKKDGFIDS